MDTEGEEADEDTKKGSKESPAKGKGDKKASPAKAKSGNMLSDAISSAKVEVGSKKRKASEEKANSAEKKKKWNFMIIDKSIISLYRFKFMKQNYRK